MTKQEQKIKEYYHYNMDEPLYMPENFLTATETGARSTLQSLFRFFILSLCFISAALIVAFYILWAIKLWAT